MLFSLLYFLLILANVTLAFSLNNVVFLTGFLSIIIVFSFLLCLFNYVLITLFLLIAYTSIILILFLVNGLLTMHSLSLKYISASNNFRLLINYSLPLCSYYYLYSSSLFIYVYFLNLITSFDYSMIYVSLLFIYSTKMNALGTSIYSFSLFLTLFT